MKRKKGFTLIEAMVAMVLIAVVVVANFEFFRYSYRLINYAELRIKASNLARETMEELYWNPDLADTNGDSMDYNFEESDQFRVDHSGARIHSVNDTNDYKVITVTVKWPYQYE